jgi:hypothetical protein
VVLSDTSSAFHDGKRIVGYVAARTKKYVLGIRRHGAYRDGRDVAGTAGKAMLLHAAPGAALGLGRTCDIFSTVVNPV